MERPSLTSVRAKTRQRASFASISGLRLCRSVFYKFTSFAVSTQWQCHFYRELTIHNKYLDSRKFSKLILYTATTNAVLVRVEYNKASWQRNVLEIAVPERHHARYVPVLGISLRKRRAPVASTSTSTRTTHLKGKIRAHNMVMPNTKGSRGTVIPHPEITGHRSPHAKLSYVQLS
jgi:hypothetical protein